MLKKYKEILYEKGIKDLDVILSDGRFYRTLRPVDDENIKMIEYNGIIIYNEDNISLLYTKKTTDKNNIMKHNLILDNYYNENNIIELNCYEDRDFIELYEEYIQSSELFRIKQQLLKKKIESEIKYNLLVKKSDLILQKIYNIYDEIEELEEKIKKTQKRLVKKRF